MILRRRDMTECQDVQLPPGHPPPRPRIHRNVHPFAIRGRGTCGGNAYEVNVRGDNALNSRVLICRSLISIGTHNPLQKIRAQTPRDMYPLSTRAGVTLRVPGRGPWVDVRGTIVRKPIAISKLARRHRRERPPPTFAHLPVDTFHQQVYRSCDRVHVTGTRGRADVRGKGTDIPTTL